MKKKRCIILLSGGLDSTTTMQWAIQHFSNPIALSFNYSQKHSVELKMAEINAKKMKIEWELINFPFKEIIHSSLIDHNRYIPEKLENSRNEKGVPFTYVPFRNGIFLSIAAAYAESRNIFDLVTGFNTIDSPDYPDTTIDFTKKMESTLNAGTNANKTNGSLFKIHTPLISKTKVEIIQMGLNLKVDYSFSISCYRGEEYPCLRCPSCEIRSNAFSQLNMKDPLISRLEGEKKI